MRPSHNEYCVYKHTTPNGKVYIGLTSLNPIFRWNNGKGYSHNAHFHSAILKYGWDNIKHEILYTGLTKEEAEKKEIELIARYKSNDRRYGYNIDNGGNCIGKMSEETKRKLRNANLGKPPGNKGKPSKYKGIPRNEETKMKIARSNGKPVLQFDIRGRFINEFYSAAEAQKITGITNISACCRGIIRKAGGYVWRWKK